MSAADYYQQTAREMRQHAMPSNNPFPESYIGYQSLPVGGQSSPAQFQKSLPLNAQPSAAQTKFKPLPSTSHTPPARDYTNKDYTIGIICALSKEKAAAECFLDAEHAQIEAQPKGDNNVYTLGSIHPHNVVIASLPEGRYGTTNAAAVARDMIRTFPKIRYGLMVGIGGGAPTAKHDIRLGDVVVALPDSLRNEVLQYDFGKTVQEKKFHRVEGMNNCPPLLKSVVSSLRTKYKRKGHPLQEYVESALKANERLRTEYQKPDPSTDILYKSDYVHPEAVDVCSRICAWKPEHMMPRPIPHSLEQELMEGIRVAKEAKERKPNEKTKDRKVKASASKVETLNKGASTTTCATWKGMSSVEAKLAGLSNVKSEPLPQHIQKAPPNIIPTLSSEPMLHSPSFIPAISSKRGIGLLPRDDPTIHYGPVASGNQLLRDAKLRDSLASEAGVLCFEMEASGLMEHFPSLVIRGICDYADTHKNDQWQGYAAMTAAAYAKDVLRNLPIQRVKDEKPAQKTILETVGNWSSVVPSGMGMDQKLDQLLALGITHQDSPQVTTRSFHGGINESLSTTVSNEDPRWKDRGISESRVAKPSGTGSKHKAQPSFTSPSNRKSKHQANIKRIRSPKKVTQAKCLPHRASERHHIAGIVQRPKAQRHPTPPVVASKNTPKAQAISRHTMHNGKAHHEKQSQPQHKLHAAYQSSKSHGTRSKHNNVSKTRTAYKIENIGEPQISGLGQLSDAVQQLTDVCKTRRSKKKGDSSTSSSDSEFSSSEEESSEKESSGDEMESDGESTEAEFSADEAANEVSSSEAEISEDDEEECQSSDDQESGEESSNAGSDAEESSGDEASSDES